MFTLECVTKFRQNGFRWQGKACRDTRVTHRVMLFPLRHIVGKAGLNRARLNQADPDATAAHFEPQRIAPGFQRIFTGGIGTPARRGDQAQQRAGINNAAITAGLQRGQEPQRQLMDAEKVAGKLLLQLLTRERMQRAIETKSGIVKQCGQTVIAEREYRIRCPIDTLRIVEIELDARITQRVHAGDIVGFSAGGDHLITPRQQIVRGDQANTAGTTCNQNGFLHFFTLFAHPGALRLLN